MIAMTIVVVLQVLKIAMTMITKMKMKMKTVPNLPESKSYSVNWR